jgi:hypothetical protein
MRGCEYVCAAPTPPEKAMCKAHSHPKGGGVNHSRDNGQYRCKYMCINDGNFKHEGRVYCSNHLRTVRNQNRVFVPSDTTNVTEGGEEITIEASLVPSSFSRTAPTDTDVNIPRKKHRHSHSRSHSHSHSHTMDTSERLRSYRLDAGLINFLNNNRDAVLQHLNVTSDLENPDTVQSFMLANQSDIIKFLCNESTNKSELIAQFNSHFPDNLASMQRVWNTYVKFEDKLKCVRTYITATTSTKNLADAYLAKSIKSNEILSFFFADLHDKCKKFIDSYFNGVDFVEYARRLIEFKKHLGAHSNDIVKISVDSASSAANVDTNFLFKFVVECILNGIDESFDATTKDYFSVILKTHFVHCE